MMSQDDLSSLKKTTVTTLKLLADSRYLEGILGIEAAFDTFMDLGPGARDIEEKISEFKSHKFELERNCRQHMCESKVWKFSLYAEWWCPFIYTKKKQDQCSIVKLLQKGYELSISCQKVWFPTKMQAWARSSRKYFCSLPSVKNVTLFFLMKASLIGLYLKYNTIYSPS